MGRGIGLVYVGTRVTAKRHMFVAMLAALLGVVGPARRASAAPEPATVGVYVEQLNSIDLKAGTFTVDFWLWFRHAPRPGRPDLIDTFELIGGRVNTKGPPVVRKPLPDGNYYEAVRINATIQHVFDLHRYPFDRHVLEIKIEDSELDIVRLVFTPDRDNAAIDPDIAISGWRTGDFTSGVVEHRYRTNYGDTSVAAENARFSRFIAGFSVNRKSSFTLCIKLISPLLFAVLIAWCAFFIRPEDKGPRVSVSVGALFAAVGGIVTLSNQLPDIDYMTFVDKMVYASLMTVAVSLGCTLASITLHYKKLETADEKLEKLDRLGRRYYPAVFLLFALLLIAIG